MQTRILKDMEYADDMSVCTKCWHIQLKVLRINCEEKLIMKTNDILLESVEELPYLGNIVFGDIGTIIDISKKINKASSYLPKRKMFGLNLEIKIKL